ncbi:MAG: ParA family protein [Propionibacteriaceae bacterium]|nr:ParA family protein [Propionibacteriaceae bacterium]
MSVIVLTSAGHSPGVTTTAVGLAVTWPRPVLLVDADPHPSQAVLAGYLQGEDPYGKGLAALLSAHRERRGFAPLLDEAALDLAPADPIARRFLPGFVNAGMVDLFASAWPEFATSLAASPADVLVDAGRVGSRGLPPALTGIADLVLVVTRCSLVDLVALRLHLPVLADSLPADRLELALIGPDRPYTAKEIHSQFGLGIAATIAWAPDQARVWSHGDPPTRRFRVGGYQRGVRQAGRDLAERLTARSELIGAPR